jgi:hypothetical protein
MFKKGQLVRSVKYGVEYIVCSDEIFGRYVRVRTPGGIHGTVDQREIALIGNNYQAKQKCSR